MSEESIIGRELGTVTFPVERGKLRELAHAFHESSPVWFERTAAVEAGFEQIPVPPTVTALIDHWRPGGALSSAHALGMDIKRLLHGEAAWDYLAPVLVGDELTATARVTGVTSREGRRGGTMKMITIETEFTNQRGELAVRRRDTLIETGAST
jgi:N-terminal half of MaoC dehydratase